MSTASVTDTLQEDHRRLDALARAAAKHVAAADFVAARRLFVEFRRGLERHIEVEEQVLFPAFEEMTGIVEGPTEMMRVEHGEILEMLGELTNALDGGDSAYFDASLARLQDIIEDHNMKEEQVLYPTCDRAAGSDAERAALVARLQAF